MALQTYEGSCFFRQRLILATISGKTVKIKKIRSKDDEPGVKGNVYVCDRSFNGVSLTDNMSG